MTQERRHLRKDVPQTLKQQIPNHQLQPQDQPPATKISHKTSEQQSQDESVSEQQPQDESVSEQPQGTSIGEQQPQGEASTSTLQEPFPSQISDDDEHSQMHGPWPEKRLPQKIPDLYQRNQDIVYDRKQITFNPFCLIFSLQIKRKTSYISETYVL